MARRLTLVLVGLMTAGLVVAGTSGYALARRAAADDARHELEAQADGLQAYADDVRSPVRRFRSLQRALDVDGVAFLVVEDGRLSGPLPEGATEDDLELDRLRGGEVLSGRRGGSVWAAAAVPVRDATALVVLTRRFGTGVGATAGWFAVAALGTLALAALVARRLAARLTASLRATEAATRRMAAGDLAARAPVPGRTDEVADLAESVNRMAAALQRASEAERSFLLSIGHDLRTPLTAVRGWGEALADGAVDDPAAAGRVVEAEARRLQRLVDDLLELARLRARRFSLDLGPVAVGEVAEEVVAAAEPAAQANGVVVSTELPAAGPTGQLVALGDPERVAQVLANLVDNAVRHARSTVVVTAAADGGRVTLAVDDDGAGVAPADRPRVLEPFWSSAGRDGAGMGLAIVAELCGAMGGGVEVQDSPLGGARLVAHLPSSRADDPPAGVADGSS